MAQSDIRAGRAYVELASKDTTLSSGLAGAKNRLVNFAAAVISVRGVIDGARAAFNLLSGPIRQFIAVGDSLDKMSKRTGVAVEALSELRHAAELTGASGESLEKGFAGLSRTLFDAKRGSKEASDALSAIGISFKQLDGLSPDAQMELIADGLSKITNESTRGAVAQRLFGRAGRQLLPMLKEGKAGLEEMRQAARDAGITMTADTASGAADLLDRLTTLKSTVKNLVVNIGSAMLPIIDIVLPPIQRLATTGIKAMQALSAGVQAAIKTATTFLSNAWMASYNVVAPLIGALRVVADEAFTAIGAIVSSVWGGVSETTSSVWNTISVILGDVLNWMRNAFMTALSAISFAIKNWQLVAQVAFKSAQVAVVTFANQVIHFFTEVLPAYLSWFGNHWREVFTDIVNFTKTVATNIFANLKSLWDGIVSLFSGEGFTFEWTPLTEGFKSAITELPKIAEREMGPLEKSLKDELNAITGELSKEWDAHQKEFGDKVKAFTPTESEFGAIVKQQDNIVKRRAEDVASALDPDMNKRKSEIAGSFSAAALAGLAGGPNEKLLKEIKEQERKQKIRDDRLLAAVQKSGVIGA